MTKVLITGATGTVGREVLSALQKIEHPLNVYAGVRDLESDREKLSTLCTNFSPFDFTDISSFDAALTDCEILFLLRPPHISEVHKYFKPLMEACVRQGVKHVVFLSVQGVENSKIIPHHKIEKLIVDSKIHYTFLRPAYFMQNFTTTLRANLVNNKQIYLPAGNAKFTLIDVRDIGEVAATVLTNVAAHTNKSYELTCNEKLNFSEMAHKLSVGTGVKIQFKSPSLVGFFLRKRREQVPVMLILVMIMLHYFPRFQKEPRVTDWVQKITNRHPIDFNQFVQDYKSDLTDQQLRTSG